MPSTRRRTAIALGIALALAGGVALVWTGLDPAASHGPAEPGPAVLPGERLLSLLAVGDTGEILPWRPFGEGQRSMARGLAAEDRREPVDALLLLGDNFYPDGLQRFELLTRLRRNLVGPFCRFTSTTGPRWSDVSDACLLAPEQRHPIPILAVLGNHDYNSEESPVLQREVVQEFVANWDVHANLVDVTPLGDDVSLVRVDSEIVKMSDTAEGLRGALERAPGRWRILAVHEPLTLREDENPGPRSYKSLVRQAIRDSRRPPQLVLAGHDHNLQVAPLALGGPALQVIAGGGSSRRSLKEPGYRDRAFGMPTTGFARIDLLGRGRAQGLLVSLYSTPRYPVHFWRGPRLVSQWWVQADGRAGRLFPPDA